MNAVARTLTANICLSASALVAGAIARGVLTLDDTVVSGAVANTVGALVWMVVMVDARAHSFWARVFGSARA